MRISGIKSIAAVVFASALLGGCGEAPYELTQSEQNIIIDYSAHVVAKHNTSQKKGLVTVDMEEVTPEGPKRRLRTVRPSLRIMREERRRPPEQSSLKQKRQ